MKTCKAWVHPPVRPVPGEEPYIYAQLQAAAGEHRNGNGSPAERPGVIWVPASPDGTRTYSEEELRAREQASLERGRAEGEARVGAESEKAIATNRESIAETLQVFERERHSYYRRVEAEVVRLALQVARKILHREAQIDPLLLQGVVRVALEKLASGTTVKLRVAATAAEEWRRTFSSDGPEPVHEIVPDPALDAGQCVIETDLGSTDLSFDAQLKEIEQGFLDLLAARPEKSE